MSVSAQFIGILNGTNQRDVRPFVKRNGPVGELCEHEKLLLLDLALAKSGIYLQELQQELYSRMLHWVDTSTICRTMHHIGIVIRILDIQGM